MKNSVVLAMTALSLIIVGVFIGLFMAEQPPYDWEKWGVFGTWFGALMTAFVACIATWLGATLPKRIAQEELRSKVRPFAVHIGFELQINLSRLYSIHDWIKGKPNSWFPGDIKVTKNDFESMIGHIKADDPYLAYSIEQTVRQLEASFLAACSGDGAGGYAAPSTPKDVNIDLFENALSMTQDCVISDIRTLGKKYGLEEVFEAGQPPIRALGPDDSEHDC